MRCDGAGAGCRLRTIQAGRINETAAGACYPEIAGLIDRALERPVSLQSPYGAQISYFTNPRLSRHPDDRTSSNAGPHHQKCPTSRRTPPLPAGFSYLSEGHHRSSRISPPMPMLGGTPWRSAIGLRFQFELDQPDGFWMTHLGIASRFRHLSRRFR
jgi:hypothetical protein